MRIRATYTSQVDVDSIKTERANVVLYGALCSGIGNRQPSAADEDRPFPDLSVLDVARKWRHLHIASNGRPQSLS